MRIDTNPNMRFMKEYQKGDIVFEQDSEGDELFVVISGSVEILQKQNNRFKALVTLGKGEIFGEMALVERIPRTARAVAVEDTTQLIVVDQPRFVYLVSQQPVFALTIMRVLCNRIHSLEKRHTDLLNERSRS